MKAINGVQLEQAGTALCRATTGVFQSHHPLWNRKEGKVTRNIFGWRLYGEDS